MDDSERRALREIGSRGRIHQAAADYVEATKPAQAGDYSPDRFYDALCCADHDLAVGAVLDTSRFRPEDADELRGWAKSFCGCSPDPENDPHPPSGGACACHGGGRMGYAARQILQRLGW